MTRNLLFRIIFVGWIIGCLAVRLVGLEKSPVSLNFDEAGLGYNAYSLMLTGKDEYGAKWPLAIRSFNDYKPALYSYLTIPLVKLIGLNQTSTRGISAIFGSLSLIFWFLIFKKIGKVNRWLALGAAIFVSLLPWRLHFSRVAFESNLSMCFFTAMVWSLLNFEKRWGRLGVIIGALLAIYSYHGARLAVPLLLTAYFLDPIGEDYVWKNWKKLWPVVGIAILAIPIFLANNSSSVMQRFNQTNIFKAYYPYAPRELVAKENPWSDLRFQPLYYLGGIVTGHLLSYITPRNLTIELYHWVTRSPQVISGGGMIGWLGGIFLLIGAGWWISRVVEDKNRRLLLYWMLAGVAPAVVTIEWFHPLRSLNAFPAIEILVGIGLVAVLRKITSQKLAVAVLLMAGLGGVVVMNATYNVMNELNYSIWDSNGEFQAGGYKEGADLLWGLKDKYKTVYLDSPHAQNYVMFLLYMKYPPENIHRVADSRPPMGTEGFLNFNFDNFVYRKYDWPIQRHEGNFVLWTSAEVKENEIEETPGAKLYKIKDAFGRWAASVITKE